MVAVIRGRRRATAEDGRRQQADAAIGRASKRDAPLSNGGVREAMSRFGKDGKGKGCYSGWDDYCFYGSGWGTPFPPDGGAPGSSNDDLWSG